MAYLTKRYRKDKNGKKIAKHIIVWHDWSKSEDERSARRETDCKKHGATNAEDRKKLLKKYQDDEDATLKDIEIFGTNENLDRPEKLINNLIDEFLAYRKTQSDLRREKGGRIGIAYNTYWENLNSLKFLKQFCERNNILRCKQFTTEKAQEFRNWLETNGNSPTTNSKILRSIKLFFNNYMDFTPSYFKDTNLIIRKLKNFPAESRVPRVFTVEELRMLIRTAIEHDRLNTSKGYSPVLPIVLLLTFTGMRLNEALSLRWDNVNLENGVITIQAKKTHKARLLPLISDPSGKISSSFFELLRLWKMKAGSSEYVLPSPFSTKPILSVRAWSRFAKMSAIMGNTPKSYRSSFVSYALCWGIPIPVLSHFTGHSMDVIQNHYYSYVVERKTGETLEHVMGLNVLMQEIIAGYKGQNDLKHTKWA